MTSQSKAIPRPILNSQVPERRDGSKTLKQIPADVYYDIFEYFQAGETFSERDCKIIRSNLIPVCQLFRAICLPRRLRSLIFSSQQGNFVKFKSTEFREPHANLYGFVYALRLVDWLPVSSRRSQADIESDYADKTGQGTQNERLPRDLMTRFSDNLPRFQNVTKLTIDHAMLRPSFFTHVPLMNSLHSVDIAHCSYDDASTTDPYQLIVPTMPRTPWRKLRLVGNTWYDDVMYALATVTCTPALETFITNEWYAVRRFLTHESVLVNLQTLVIPGEEPNVIGKFLAATPTITTLTITGTPEFATASQASLRLPPSALPNLHTRVSNVTVMTTNFGAYGAKVSFTVDVMSVLSRSTAPIRSLGLEIYPFDLVKAEGLDLRNFAQLERFAIYASADEHTYTELMKQKGLPVERTIWHPTASTVDIVFNFCVEPDLLVAYDLQADHDLLCPLFESMFPSVKTINTCPGIEWRKRMHGNSGVPVWKPVIIARDDVRSRILANVDSFFKVKDYEGCLKGLFEGGELNSTFRKVLGVEDDV